MIFPSPEQMVQCNLSPRFSPRHSTGAGREHSLRPGTKTLRGWSNLSLETLFFATLCQHFSLPSAPMSILRSESGFSNWKKALYRNGGFRDHCKSEHHRSAVFAWTQHKLVIEKKNSMIESISKEREKRVKENQIYIKTIAQVLLLTAVQNISQRGHMESEGSDNPSNILAILDAIAQHDSLIEKRMNAHGNAKYTSKNIQNEILEMLAEMVQLDIIKEVKQSEVFSII
ncbi:hypothetical protein UPYG_G00243790, partial [Umbra pygmaea]